MSHRVSRLELVILLLRDQFKSFLTETFASEADGHPWRLARIYTAAWPPARLRWTARARLTGIGTSFLLGLVSSEGSMARFTKVRTTVDIDRTSKPTQSPSPAPTQLASPQKRLTRRRSKQFVTLAFQESWSLIAENISVAVTGQPDCSWPIQFWCASTTTDMHPSGWRPSWMVFGLGKNVDNETQSSQQGHIEIVKLILVLFVRLMFFQYEACFVFIKKNYSYYEPRT